MPISWNEIRHNAVAFSKEWASETREEAEAKSFWDEFFQVFGIRRRTVASFEEPVKKLSGNWGFIDLFWPGTLLVEHKSLGKPLVAAQSQAMGEIPPTKGIVDEFYNDSTGEGDEGEVDARGPWNEGNGWKFIDAPAFNGGIEPPSHKSNRTSARSGAKK